MPIIFTKMTNWLPLIDYSNKHRISISTLRRRIKHETINFKLDEGKYFILDETPDRSARGRKTDSVVSPIENDSVVANEHQSPEPRLSPTHHVLEELKKAYTLILQEKEEQIRFLRDEISDLRTLIKVLEGENARLLK